jgi:putative oxidoreductase
VARDSYHVSGTSLLQRLFSTFADGWPGFGLLLLRFGAAVPLIVFGIAGLGSGIGQSFSVVRGLIEVVCGLLLLVGLWTPIAAILVAVDRLSSAFSMPFAHQEDQWLHIVLGVLAAGIAMLGPGAWSVDAHLFGRKRFEVNGPSRHDPSNRDGPPQ